MSNETRDVTAQYREAEKRADALCDYGSDMVNLPAIRRSSFIQGYAACLIDMKYGKSRQKTGLKSPSSGAAKHSTEEKT